MSVSVGGESQATATTTTPLLRVVEMEGKGRAMVASGSLKAGQIVLRDSPILLYSALPLTQHAPLSSDNSYCSNCFRNLPPTSTTALLSCPSCRALFCSPNCRSVALVSSHSPWVCQALSRLRDCPSLRDSPQNHERQLQARFLVAAYNLALVSPSDFQTLLSLQGEGCSDAATLFLHSLISSLSPPPQCSSSAELTAALLARDKLNAFGLMEPFTQDGHRSVRAYAIYPKASFFNHDCLPNACRFDYLDTAAEGNTDIIVRAIHDVPQGREICLSYFPVNLNYSDRQRRLMEGYGFTCECDRCKVEVNWSDKDEDEDVDVDVMDEDEGEEEADEEGEQTPDHTDFPHAYFFLRYMCNRDNCWGTLAPLPPSLATPSNIMECNVCGNLKNDEEIEDRLVLDE